MRDDLLHYYERELRFIRRQAADFARRYPAIAGQLLLEPEKCEDPHVERLIEAFAMMSARVQLRLDDEFPEISGAFLEALYPHYLAPVPSLTMVQMETDPARAEGTTGVRVPRHSLLYTRPVGGTRCRFRTCYDLTLWPATVATLDLVPLDPGTPGCPPGARAALRARLRTLGSQRFADMPLGSLRFFLDGDAAVAHQLYELLLREPLGLLVRPDPGGGRRAKAPVRLGPEAIRPVGFGRHEDLLGAPRASRRATRLLQEYFLFPDKFLFVELAGLTPAVLAGAGQEIELLVLLDRLPLELEGNVGPENFKLGCTPAVNLFPHQAEPIRLEHTRAEYPVVPDAHAPDAFEVFAVTEVETVAPGTGRVTEFRPFYELRHGEAAETEPAFWQASRRPSPRRDDAGTEIALALVDRASKPAEKLPGETLVVRCLCTNRDLPPRLPLGEGRGDFQIEGQTGVAGIRSLRKPTPPLRGHLDPRERWRLVSLLSLNHLSLVAEETATDARGEAARVPVALRELLGLLDFTDSAVTRQRIAGLTGVEARRVLRQIETGEGRVFARGLEIAVELDEPKYTGSGAYLFASVLERFFGLYASVNSFTQTVARVRQREEVLKRWPPRAGDQALL